MVVVLFSINRINNFFYVLKDFNNNKSRFHVNVVLPCSDPFHPWSSKSQISGTDKLAELSFDIVAVVT